ncbi:SDR family oxidoreductase [Planktomarina temperata]|nr:SDR family oxidoreductase [Planktomarina temperata]
MVCQYGPVETFFGRVQVKILITGGFGYVGGRLGMHLASSPLNHVYLGSRVHRQRPRWLKQGDVIKMDWSDQSSLEAACENMDAIIHTAGCNAADCLKSPTLALEVNGLATERLVAAALQKDVSKLIYLSTAHVYASDLSGVITEDSKISNLHPYATSHIAGENAVIDGHSRAGLQSIVVRLANSFGAPASLEANCWILVVNDLCRQAVINGALVIKGPSNTVRNFVSMTDVCLAIEHLTFDHGVRLSPLVCNLGGSEKTIFDIASVIRTIFAKNTDTILPIHELAPPRPSTTVLDFRSRILEEMGYKPTLNLKEEISSLIKFCASNFKNRHAE